MKLSFRKMAGIACALVMGANVQAQSLSSSEEYVLGLAAELYPDLFNVDHQPIKAAQGYTYITYSSGVAVGFKDGSLFLTGGPFGTQIKNMGTVSKVTTDLTLAKNRLTVTPTADMTNLFNLAAQVYPSIFQSGGSFQVDANGYLYKYFSSGVYAAIKDGVVYVKGGSYGSAYTSVGALNTMLSRLQTAVNGGGNSNPGGGTSIPSGNYNLTVSGSYSMSGPVVISYPFSFTVAGIPAPNVSDQNDIKKAFSDAVASSSGSGITITNFSYTTKSNTADLVEFDVSVSASISTAAGPIGYTYSLNYKYTK